MSVIPGILRTLIADHVRNNLVSSADARAALIADGSVRQVTHGSSFTLLVTDTGWEKYVALYRQEPWVKNDDIVRTLIGVPLLMPVRHAR